MKNNQVQQAERIRKELGIGPDEFSILLGYSATAYRMAIRRGKISRWMMREVDRVGMQRRFPVSRFKGGDGEQS